MFSFTDIWRWESNLMAKYWNVNATSSFLFAQTPRYSPVANVVFTDEAVSLLYVFDIMYPILRIRILELATYASF